jgi:hypothetical protein
VRRSSSGRRRVALRWRCTCPPGVSTGRQHRSACFRSLLAAGAAAADRLFLRCGRSRRSGACPASPAACAATCCATGARRGCMTSSRSRPPIACWAADGRYRGAGPRPNPDPAHRYRTHGGASSTGGVAARLARLSRGLRRDHGLLPKQRAIFGAAYPRCRTACGAPANRGCALPAAWCPDRGPSWVSWATSTRRKGARDRGAGKTLGRGRRPAADRRHRQCRCVGFSMPARVKIHGGYRRDDIAELRGVTASPHGSCPRSGPRPIPSPRGRRLPPACRSSPSTSAPRGRPWRAPNGVTRAL